MTNLAKMKDVLGWVIPDRETCREAARRLAAEHPGETPEELARRAVRHAVPLAVGTGGATGAASSPLTMIPAAVADVAAMLRIEGMLAGMVAALLDPKSLDEPGRFEGDVVSIVFPGAVSQALRTVGVRAGQAITKNLVRKYFGEAFLQTVGRYTARYALGKLTQKAILTKAVPLIGAGIGAGWNWVEVNAVGRRAIRYFQNRAVGGDAEPAEDEPKRRALLPTAQKLLPWYKSAGDREATPRGDER